MGMWKEMSITSENLPLPAAGSPEAPAATPQNTRLNIFVVFTAVESTLAALREAGSLANRLSVRVTLVVPQVVPYPLPLATPPVRPEWNERRFRLIAGESPVETAVCIFLCRDPFETLMSVLPPGSVVILGGGRRRWWPTREKMLARKLRRAGHEVVFKEHARSHRPVASQNTTLISASN